MSAQERFERKIDRDGSGGCWFWRGSIAPNGYGRFSNGGKLAGAHRVSYEFYVGPIPEGLDLDHLCRMRHCVNPEHLEPVTRRENLRRSPITVASLNARKTHCLRGHEFAGENLWIDGRGCRRCRTCHRLRQAA